MIKVHLDLHHITVQGHAPRVNGEAPGQNIVCAAVSALTLTLIEGLEAIAGMTVKAFDDPGGGSERHRQGPDRHLVHRDHPDPGQLRQHDTDNLSAQPGRSFYGRTALPQ